MTPTERQVERIATIWPTPRMSRFARLEYAQALEPYHPDAQAAAINSVRDTWLKDIAPPPGEFVAKAIAAEAGMQRYNPDIGDGRGCPQCRREYPVGHHAHWIGDGKIIACTEHQWTWPGTTHQPDETDPGELASGEWRRRAAAGEYGHVCKALAVAGKAPAAVTHAVATDLRTELAETTRKEPALR